MPISQSELREKADYFSKSLHEARKISASISKAKSAFLCHSHKDEVLVKGLIRKFEEAGVELYVDWEDHTMPDTPNAETARKIQRKIRECRLFLFLATANSKASRWCPWEIGYADSSGKNIYIIPTTDGCNDYGNEYLGLYSHIESGSSDDGRRRGLAVFGVGRNKGEWVSEASL